MNPYYNHYEKNQNPYIYSLFYAELRSEWANSEFVINKIGNHVC